MKQTSDAVSRHGDQRRVRHGQNGSSKIQLQAEVEQNSSKHASQNVHAQAWQQGDASDNVTDKLSSLTCAWSLLFHAWPPLICKRTALNRTWHSLKRNRVPPSSSRTTAADVPDVRAATEPAAAAKVLTNAIVKGRRCDREKRKGRPSAGGRTGTVRSGKRWVPAASGGGRSADGRQGRRRGARCQHRIFPNHQCPDAPRCDWTAH